MTALSVVTINLNDRSGLTKTARSVGAQADGEFEWVVVDGGSSDGSMEIFSDPGIRQPSVAQSAKDNGIYDAMNSGITLTSGDFVLFMNSGDTFADADSVSMIKSRLGTSEAPDCALFGFEYGGKRRKPRPLLWRYWSLPTSHQAMTYRRKLLEDQPFDDSYRFAADFEHFLRISSLGYRIRTFPDIAIWNDEYGCKFHLETVREEYQRALTQVLWPSVARVLVGVRFGYLKRVI